MCTTCGPSLSAFVLYTNSNGERRTNKCLCGCIVESMGSEYQQMWCCGSKEGRKEYITTMTFVIGEGESSRRHGSTTYTYHIRCQLVKPS